MVWRQLPKLIPAGSIPVSRSTKIGRVKALPIFCCGESGREPQAPQNSDRTQNSSPLVVRARRALRPKGAMNVSRSTKIGRVKALPIFCCGESGREPQAALSTDRKAPADFRRRPACCRCDAAITPRPDTMHHFLLPATLRPPQSYL